MHTCGEYQNIGTRVHDEALERVTVTRWVGRFMVRVSFRCENCTLELQGSVVRHGSMLQKVTLGWNRAIELLPELNYTLTTLHATLSLVGFAAGVGIV